MSVAGFQGLGDGLLLIILILPCPKAHGGDGRSRAERVGRRRRGHVAFLGV